MKEPDYDAAAVRLLAPCRRGGGYDPTIQEGTPGGFDEH